MKATSSFFVICMTTACMSGGGGTEGTVSGGVTGQPNSPYNERMIAMDALDVNVDDVYDRSGITNLSAIPVGASAGYTGFFDGILDMQGDNLSALVGVLEVHVNFDDGATSGVASELLDANGDPITGIIPIYFGRLGETTETPETNFYFLAKTAVSAPLEDKSGREFSLELTFAGNIVGAEHEAIQGTLVTGTANIIDGAAYRFVGDFVLELDLEP